jgi:apolipoprotein N-acyltransferase
MEFVADSHRTAIAVVVFMATAACVFFGNGLAPIWPLMWLAPFPAVLFALRSPAWLAALVAAGGFFVGCLNLWSYLRYLGAPAVAWIVPSGAAAVVFAAGVLLTRALVRRGAVWSAWLALPAPWVAFEYLRSVVSPQGSVAAVAYSQLDFLPFLQFASVAGPWGMGFVLMLFPVGLALGLHWWNRSRGQALAVATATVGVVTAVLIFGAVRLQIAQPGPQVKVGLVASDAEGDLYVAQPGTPTQRLFGEYARRAQGLIERGAQVVVLPENLGVVLDSDVDGADARFQAIADRTGTMLVAGMTHAVSQTIKHNEARIYTPGAAVLSYDKERLLPTFESIYTPGISKTLLKALGKTTGQPWGVAICKDLDFTEPARGYGRSGVGLMLVPAWDFRMDAFYHGHVAVMRAVEDGFSLVRAARNGLLTVADDRGRIVGETASHAAPFAMLMATVPTGHDATLYLRLGDWFGWCAIFLLAAVLAVAVRPASWRAHGRITGVALPPSGSAHVPPCQ